MKPLERCFVCGARDWRDARRTRRVRCSHCAVVVDPARYDAAGHARSLHALLRPGPLDLAAESLDAALPFGMDAFTLRIAASAVPLGVEPMGPEEAVALAHPHAGPARAYLVPLPPSGTPALPPAFGIGAIARVGAAPKLAEQLSALAPPGTPVVIVADTDPTELASLERVSERYGDVRIRARPLAGDFGSQRNAVQDALRAAGARWALQLDDDETVDPAEIDALRALTGQADRQGTVSIGLRRANLVDGERSDLWPDMQYRLNRTHVRYLGRVHERSDAGHWRRTMIALRGTIRHELDGERVRARSRTYERMEAGGGRAGDEAALLRPFTP